METKKIKQKETQGSRKIKQKLEDLKRNDYFKKSLDKSIQIYKNGKESNDTAGDIINSLFKEYIKLGRKTEKAIKKDIKLDWMTTQVKIAEEYSLDCDLFSYLTWPIIMKLIAPDIKLKSLINPRAEIDMCCITDNYDDYLMRDNDKYFPLILNPAKQSHIIAYPVSIDIHCFATKRDVLDFIEKKWKNINACLSSYRNKDIRIRKRKHNQKLVDFIWKNKNLKIVELKNKLDKYFPDNKLFGYDDIYKIISIEKQRRTTEV